MIAPRRGFTLVELLVVISILAVLAGILFPVVMQSRRASLRTVCQSNLRQIGMALSIYATEHDETFPNTGDPTLWMGRRWRPVIDPYLRAKKVYWCPADSGATSAYDATSYAYLQTFYHHPEDFTPDRAFSLLGAARTSTAPTATQGWGQVKYPDQKILIYEWYSNHDRALNTMWQESGRHQAAFVDGHVDLVAQERLRTNALGDKDPNWTIDGLSGRDVE